MAALGVRLARVGAIVRSISHCRARWLMYTGLAVSFAGCSCALDKVPVTGHDRLTRNFGQAETSPAELRP